MEKQIERAHEQSVSDYALQNEYRANRYCAVSMLLLALGLTVHLLFFATNLYIPAERGMVISGLMCYIAAGTAVLVQRKYNKLQKYVALAGLLLGGAIIYIVICEDAGAFLIFPMIAAGMYTDRKLYTITYIHLLILNVVGVAVFFWMDIEILHYYGVYWEVNKFLSYALPMAVYLTVVYMYAMYLHKTGRGLYKFLYRQARHESKHEAQIEACAQVQQGAYPSRFDLAPGLFDLSGTVRPANEAAGDFFDLFLTEKGHLVGLVADVSDKGLDAALYMMSARNTIRALYSALDDPAIIMQKANDVLCDTASGQFVTMFLLDLDVQTGDGVFVNAGHNPPVLMKKGQPALLETQPQPFLGSFPGITYRADPLHMEKGDTLCIYTDGVVDALSSTSQPFGTERVMKTLRGMADQSSEKMQLALMKATNEWADTRLFSDDETLLIVRRTGETE